MILKNAARRDWRMLCLICAAIWALLGFALPIAHGEGDGRAQLKISITAKPREMVEPGDVMLNFTIENISAVSAHNVYLSSSDGLLSEPVGELAAGESQSFNRQHSVTQEELDAGEISYILSHDDPFDPDSKVNYTVAAAIGRSDVQPSAELTRQLSSRKVQAGDTITITYRIRNTGNVALTNLRVQDTLGDFTGRVDRLEVGKSQTLIGRVVLDEAAVSSATLYYNVENDDEETYSVALTDLNIPIAQAGLTTDFSAVRSPFSTDGADVMLTLTNTGSADILNLRVMDAIYGGTIADSITVAAGETVEISRSYALRGDMNFRWSLIAASETGEAIAYTTEDAFVEAPAGEFLPPEIQVFTDTPRICRSGNVRVRVRISNPAGMDLQDVALSEASMGELVCFAAIPAKGSVEREFSFYVDETADYAFSAAYTDFSGAQQRAYADALQIAIASDGVLPEGARPGLIEFTGNSIKIGGSRSFAALLIAGLSVLLVLIVLLLIASRRARLEKQLRIAAEKQRRREEQCKSARNPAARSAKNKPKGRN